MEDDDEQDWMMVIRNMNSRLDVNSMRNMNSRQVMWKNWTRGHMNSRHDCGKKNILSVREDEQNRSLSHLFVVL